MNGKQNPMKIDVLLHGFFINEVNNLNRKYEKMSEMKFYI